jgi:predicted nucleic acid-binding protein
VNLVYWDTMLFIYWLEAHPVHGPQVEQIYRRMDARGDQLCTGVLTIGEVLTGAYKAGRTDVAIQIKKFFTSGELKILPFTSEVAERYAFIRAQQRVSPADAIHLATASVARVDLYLTNDVKLRKLVIDGIKFFAGLDGNIF